MTGLIGLNAMAAISQLILKSIVPEANCDQDIGAAFSSKSMLLGDVGANAECKLINRVRLPTWPKMPYSFCPECQGLQWAGAARANLGAFGFFGRH